MLCLLLPVLRSTVIIDDIITAIKTAIVNGIATVILTICLLYWLQSQWLSLPQQLLLSLPLLYASLIAVMPAMIILMYVYSAILAVIVARNITITMNAFITDCCVVITKVSVATINMSTKYCYCQYSSHGQCYYMQ